MVGDLLFEIGTTRKFASILIVFQLKDGSKKKSLCFVKKF